MLNLRAQLLAALALGLVWAGLLLLLADATADALPVIERLLL